MNALIITVAGLSSRFSKSIGCETLKCIYSQKDYKSTLIYNLIHENGVYDYYVIVGGYKYSELEKFIDSSLNDIREKIILVNNEKYSEYGSGYSLYLGIKALHGLDINTITFAEGDLFLDKESLISIHSSKVNVITINNEIIDSNKSVVLYKNSDDEIKYLYDLNHSLLEIKEPFKQIYNSGQVWKFVDISRLFDITYSLSEIEQQGTNLVIIQKYFQQLNENEYEIIRFNKWINCNTIEDYIKAGI